MKPPTTWRSCTRKLLRAGNQDTVSLLKPVVAGAVVVVAVAVAADVAADVVVDEAGVGQTSHAFASATTRIENGTASAKKNRQRSSSYAKKLPRRSGKQKRKASAVETADEEEPDKHAGNSFGKNAHKKRN
jgi:hypothetical protein